MKTILTLFALIISIQITWAQESEIGETEKQKRPRTIIYKPYNTPVNAEFPVTTQKKLYIENGAGFIKITSGDTDKIIVEGNVFTVSLRKKSTEKFIENYLVFDFMDNEDKILLKGLFEGYKTRRGNRYKASHMIGTLVSKVELKITLPKGMNVEINDNSGSISVEHFEGDVEIRDGSGGVYLKDITGNVELRDGSGGINVDRIAGDLKINDGSGNIDINNIQGDVSLRDASGGIYARGVTQSISITDASGTISLENIASDTSQEHEVYIKDASGGIYALDLGTKATIIDTSGGITVRGVEGNLRINDTSGGISATNINGRLLVKDRSGKINTDRYVVANGKDN